MKPEAQRIAIAEACGWKPVYDKLNGTYGWRSPLAKWWKKYFKHCSPAACDIAKLPDYLNDLNARQAFIPVSNRSLVM